MRSREESIGKSGIFRELEELFGESVFPFSSGRAALVFALRALGFTRRDEILIPPFLSDCVISAISKTAFPSLTPSKNTKAIYVYHQFGYPQDLKKIEQSARNQGWIIINSCVNSLYTKYHGEWIIKWGDFSILSFPKLYSCCLGGGLLTKREELKESVKEKLRGLSGAHQYWANKAYDDLFLATQLGDDFEKERLIQSVYGYLPNVLAFPEKAANELPTSTGKIIEDIERRRRLSRILTERIPEIIPKEVEKVVGTAIPIILSKKTDIKMFRNERILKNYSMPLLHFDYNQNMFEPSYRLSAVVELSPECSEETMEVVANIASLLVKK